MDHPAHDGIHVWEDQHVLEIIAEAGVTGYTVEKALKEALGFSPQGRCLPPGMPAPPGRQGEEGVS